MDSFVTIKSFTYPYELAILRSRLESENIECFVKDELTVQVNPFYSNAIGGIKLQVRESDLQRATEILKEAGYLDDVEIKPSKLTAKLNYWTLRIPFLNRIQLEFRLIIIVTFAITLAVVILHLSTLPTKYEKLTNNMWCVDYVTFNGKYYRPNSENLGIVVFYGLCNERIDLGTNGEITLPGFESRMASGNWHIKGNSIKISRADTFDFVYNGIYEMDFTNNELILKSPKTTIYCYANH